MFIGPHVPLGGGTITGAIGFMARTLRERFNEKVDKQGEDDCWIWNASIRKDGYGSFSINGKTYTAHRIAYCLANFIDHRDLSSLVVVMHSCDNRLCVNSRHLSLGKIQDNNADCVEKGRQARGATSGSAKFSETQIKRIREIHAQGVSCLALADLLKVSDRGIGKIVNRETWKHLGSKEESI